MNPELNSSFNIITSREHPCLLQEIMGKIVELIMGLQNPFGTQITQLERLYLSVQNDAGQQS
jgi:hypothetical protein